MKGFLPRAHKSACAALAARSREWIGFRLPRWLGLMETSPRTIRQRSRTSHETFAPCHSDHDGHCRRRRGVDGICAAKRLRPRTDQGIPARAERPLAGILPRQLWRFRRRAASAARALSRPWRSRPWRRIAAEPCGAFPAPSARTGASRLTKPVLIFTPSMASAIGMSAPAIRSRWRRSKIRSRRRPARSTRCASNSSPARSTTRKICDD